MRRAAYGVRGAVCAHSSPLPSAASPRSGIGKRARIFWCAESSGGVPSPTARTPTKSERVPCELDPATLLGDVDASAGTLPTAEAAGSPSALLAHAPPLHPDAAAAPASLPAALGAELPMHAILPPPALMGPPAAAWRLLAARRARAACGVRVCQVGWLARAVGSTREAADHRCRLARARRTHLSPRHALPVHSTNRTQHPPTHTAHNTRPPQRISQKHTRAHARTPTFTHTHADSTASSSMRLPRFPHTRVF